MAKTIENISENKNVLNPMEQWKADQKEFEIFGNGQIFDLIDKYKEYPDITQEQIKIVNSSLSAEGLAVLNPVSDFLKTEYATSNNITSEINPTEIENVTELHLLIVKDKLGKAENGLSDCISRETDLSNEVHIHEREDYLSGLDSDAEHYSELYDKAKKDIDQDANYFINEIEKNEAIYNELKTTYDSQKNGIQSNQHLTEEMEDFRKELDNTGFTLNNTETEQDNTYKLINENGNQEITSTHSDYTFSIHKSKDSNQQNFKIQSKNNKYPQNVADYPNFKKHFLDSVSINANTTKVSIIDRIKSFFSRLSTPSIYTPELMRENPYKIQELTKPSKELQIAAVETDPSVIRFIQNPSKEVQLLAVETNPSALLFITNPSEKAIETAIKVRPSLLQQIQDPSEAIQLSAVKSDAYSIQYIKNPSDVVKHSAIQQNPNVIWNIENPAIEMQLEAIQHSTDSQFIEKVEINMVKQNPLSIAVCSNPSEPVQLAAVNIEPFVIGKISNPTESAQLAAIKKDIFALKYIKEPAESVSVFAVQSNPESFRMINSHTPNTCKATIESLYNIRINENVKPEIVQQTLSFFSQLDNTNRAYENGKIRIPSEIKIEREQIIDNFYKEIKSQYSISEVAVKDKDILTNKDQTLYSSGARTLIGDVSSTKDGNTTQTNNFRIMDKSTGTILPLDIKGIDICNQPRGSVEKLLSGGQTELISNKGVPNLFSINKGPTGYALKVGQQIFKQAESASEI